MALPPLIRPHVNAQPTLDTAIWFMQLRWVAVAGQLLTMAVVMWVLRIALPVTELGILIGVTAATNACYGLWLGHLRRLGINSSDRLPSAQVISGLMLTDIVVLTGMLYLSAGIANPFSLFYFVNIAVAGALISPAWAWTVWATTVVGVIVLLQWSMPLAELSHTSAFAADEQTALRAWTIPKMGYLVSFATCSGVITYFITLLTGELRQREHLLQEAEDARVRNRQLEGMATLAAGAAHELATPMSTIAVVAKELSRALDKQGAPDATRQDVVLIRSELDQCRQILDRMTSAAGEAAGERLCTISLQDFLDETLLGLRRSDHVNVEISEQDAVSESLLPVQGAAQALRNLLQNAIDAGSENDRVRLFATAAEEQWVLHVQDKGSGMSPEVLERIGEPFFTTKEPGRGMGLGLHLTQNVIRRLNGTLSFESELGSGTTAKVILPTSRD